MTNNAPHTPTDDGELRKAYRRCDVSNNGTVDPMNEDEFVAYIHQYGNTRAVEERNTEHWYDGTFGKDANGFELGYKCSCGFKSKEKSTILSHIDWKKTALTQPQKENK